MSIIFLFTEDSKKTKLSPFRFHLIVLSSVVTKWNSRLSLTRLGKSSLQLSKCQESNCKWPTVKEGRGTIF